MVIVSTTPEQGATNISRMANIEVVFDADIDPASIDNASLTIATTRPQISLDNDDKLAQSVSYSADQFINDEFLGVARGDITIDETNPKKLVFTPSLALSPNSTYVVYVSGTISDLSGHLLGQVMSFSFVTLDEDIAQAIPEPISYSKIIGTVAQFDGQVPIKEKFSIISTSPANNSIMNTDNKIVLTFSEALADVPSSNLFRITYADPLSDDPASILAANEYTLTLNDDKTELTLTLSQDLLKENQLITLMISDKLQSSNGNKLSAAFNLIYLNKLTPYYSSTKLIRLKAGTVLEKISDLNIALTVKWTSDEADVNMRAIKSLSSSDYAYVRNRLVLYRTLGKLLLNNMNYAINDFVKEQVGEFSLSVTNKSRTSIYNKLIDEVKSFEESFSQLANLTSKGTFVKGSTNAKYNLNLGRSWNYGIQPGLNTRNNQSGNLIFDTIGKPLPFNPVG